MLNRPPLSVNPSARRVATRKFAHEVVVDADTGEILIDGVAFPYYVMDDVEVEVAFEGAVGVLRMGVIADNLTLITKDGHARPLVSAPAQVESDWARVRAQEIVRDGLSEVIAWIGEGMPR